MSSPATILLYDTQAVSPMRKCLEGSDRIVIHVSNSAMAVHAASTMVLALLVLDYSIPKEDLQKICQIARVASPAIRLMMTAAKVQEPMVRKTMDLLGLPGCFASKPLVPINIRKQTNELLEAWRRDSSTSAGVKRETPKQLQAMATRRLDEESAPSSGLRGPDPNLYELQDVLGSGGTGTVFKARDRFLDMEVAIKLINPELIKGEDVLRAFKDEARITMQLSHRFILRLYSFNVYNGCYYVVMEQVNGRSLRSLLGEYGSFSAMMVCRVLVQCASALEYAHSHNIIHKDIKPENIFLTDAGELKIIDWGSATLNNAASEEGGYIIGTPEYMSPAQKRGDIVGPGADQYALGILTYLMLTGYFPYPPGTTAEQLLGDIRPSFTALQPDLAAVLARATAPTEDEQYPTITEFVRAFLHVLDADWVFNAASEPISVEAGQVLT